MNITFNRLSFLLRYLPFVPATFLTLLLPAWASAATLNVPSTAYPTIQSAVNAAANGDTVLVADGTYSGAGNRDIDYGGKSITVTSQHGPGSTTIDCGGAASTDGSGDHRGFFIHLNETAAVVSGFTVKNGYETQDDGGGIYVNNKGAGTVTVTDCILTNSMTGGGIILQNDSTGTVKLINTAIAANAATYSGGGVTNYNNGGGTIMLTNCTITNNTAGSGGSGVYNYPGSSGTITLTNCIVYANTNDEVVTGTNVSATLAVTYSDIQGGYTGTGNLDADPKFVNTPTDLHLQSKSPCLGEGTSTGTPPLTIDGKTRPNPPSIGAYEVAASAGVTHILWMNVSGTAALWNYSPNTGAYTASNFGPYSGWTAKAVADGGTDGKTRLLWSNTNGVSALWNVTTTGSFTATNYGPYPGWTANAVSVAGNNTTHLLWTNTNGTAALWNVIGGAYQGEHDYGPYSGWTAKAIADGADGKTRLLWINTNGMAAFWNVTAATGAFSQFSFGPYAGWTAKAISASATTTHVLWSNTNGLQSMWNYNPSSGSFTTQNYGPYSGWSASAMADGSDGKTRLLWNNTNGTAAFWSVDNATGMFGAFSFGPYSGWTATAISGS